MPSYIKKIDYYIPSNRIFFKEYLEHLEEDLDVPPFKSNEEFLSYSEDILEIESVVFENKISIEEATQDLVQKNVVNSGIDPESIDYVIVASDNPKHQSVLGHFIQETFMMKNAKVITVSGNYCANIDISLDISRIILNSTDRPTNILVFSGSFFGNKLEERIVGSYGILGDSIGLMLLSNQRQDGIAEILDQSVIVKGELRTLDFSKDSTVLHFQTYYECLEKILKKNQVEIDGIVLHNANQMLIEQVLISQEISPNKIDKTNINKYGHLGTTDLLLNLDTFISNTAKPNNIVLSLNLGAVGTYVSTLFKTL